MIELKPCPFCGGEPYFLKPRHEKGTAFDTMMIECKHCGALPYGVSVYDGEKEEDKKAAIAKFWNRRSNGWISVKDRLPEKVTEHFSNDVIVTDGRRYYVGCYDFSIHDWKSVYAEWGETEYFKISHWMPLHELPKGDKLP